MRFFVAVFSTFLHVLISPVTLALSAALLIGAWWISLQLTRPRSPARASQMDYEWAVGPSAEWLGA
jgi:hypothetical protein